MTDVIPIPMAAQRLGHVWRTTVHENITGAETARSSLLTWPRIRMDNQLVINSGAKRRFLFAQIVRNLDQVVGLPIVVDRAVLTAQAAAGSAVLTLDDTAGRHLYAGRDLILVDAADWSSYETAEISSVDASTQITLDANLSTTWPAGTLVYPLYGCRIGPELSRSLAYDNFHSIDLAAVEAFESARSFSYSLPSIDTAVFPTYNSRPVFLYEPIYPVDETYRHPYRLIGSIGIQTAAGNFTATRGVLSRGFLCPTRTSWSDFFDFFDANQGRLGSFYMPTWAKDLEFPAGFTSTDTTLAAAELYLTAAEIEDRHLFFRFPDGSTALRQITARPTSTSITLDTAIGTTVAAGDAGRVLCSWLHHVRFDADELVFDFDARGVAETHMEFSIL